MDQHLYTLSQVAAASQLSVFTLRSYLQRKHFRIDMAIGDSPAEIAGKAHLLSYRRALQVGIAAELMRCGSEPSRAFAAAWSFTDMADDVLESGHHRLPGELFADGLTFLVAHPDDAVPGRVIRVSKTSMAHEVLFSSLHQPSRGSGTFVLVNRIDSQMREAL